MGMRNSFFMLVALLFLVACGDAEVERITIEAIMPTPRPPMTLAPTYTPAATQAPLPTSTPPPAQETAVSHTPIPFAETVLELQYQIPLLGLHRRLQGNVANQIIVVDEATGRSLQRNNEGSVMFELRQALANMELTPLPDECLGCVYVEYALTDAGLSGSGWLQDPVLLASIENFMSATLGPHFPENSVIGLRRSASPYVPGQTLAITEDGRLWRWLATEAEVDDPIGSETGVSLLAALAQIPLTELEDSYQAECRGVPIETLSLTQAGETWTGRIRCPELALPTTLQPLYVGLDDLLAEKTAVFDIGKPPAAFPLHGLFQYRRADKTQLTLFPDSTLIAIDSLGMGYTTTLTSTLPVSLTTNLLATDLLQPGFKSFIVSPTQPLTTTVTPEPPTYVLAVRGSNGIYDAEWLALPDHEIIRFLNDLLDSILPAETLTSTTVTETATSVPEENLEETTPTP